MKNHSPNGFSLIELLIVIVVIGLIAAIGIPSFKKAKLAAQNSSALQSMRVISQAQINYYASNSRYARLNELNAANENKFGTTIADMIYKGGFTYTMSPDFQTDTELRGNYEFIVSRTLEAAELPYVIKVTSNGEITQIIP